MSYRLEAVLEHYGSNVQSGRVRQVIVCPFDHESHPSCSLDLNRGLYHCFSCGESGDELTLIQKKEGVDYAASVARAIEIAGAGDESIRGRTGRRSGVSGKPGYKLKFRRGVPARTRQDPRSWA